MNCIPICICTPRIEPKDPGIDKVPPLESEIEDPNEDGGSEDDNLEEDFVACLKSQGTNIYIDTWTPADKDLQEYP